ncbi:MAG: hypothetical protein ACJ04P_07580, partial [Halioglobus sp.]
GELRLLQLAHRSAGACSDTATHTQYKMIDPQLTEKKIADDSTLRSTKNAEQASAFVYCTSVAGRLAL